MDIARALRRAGPHELLQTVQDVLGRELGAVAVELLMADYALTKLQPVTVLPYTAAPVPVRGSAPGRAFNSQEPVVEAGERTVAHVPVSVRGDRLGVLSVTLPRGADCVERLVEVAEVLGREIVVAERDTDLYLQAGRANRLTLAAEMQWQLLPGRACARPEYALGAQLEPAYTIYGDNFDWSTSADHLTLTLTNGMGEGIDAALLTNLAINALRNARRAGVDLADQARLADQAVFGQHRGRQHVSTLLLRFDLRTGDVDVVDAGSPRLWRMRGSRVEVVPFEAQLPLGMFEDTPYECQSFRVEPGDRLVFATDGVYDVVSPAGERYGENALARAITATKLLPPAQVPRAILEQLTGYRDADPSDDALVLCLDWTGRPG